MCGQASAGQQGIDGKWSPRCDATCKRTCQMGRGAHWVTWGCSESCVLLSVLSSDTRPKIKPMRRSPVLPTVRESSDILHANWINCLWCAEGLLRDSVWLVIGWACDKLQQPKILETRPYTRSLLLECLHSMHISRNWSMCRLMHIRDGEIWGKVG